METSIHSLSTLAVCALLVAAIATDLRERRIPNRLVGLGLALAAGLHAVAMVWSQPSLSGSTWWSPLAGAVAGLALLMPLHLLRACGAGDVKLMAMVGAFVGIDTAPAAVLYTFVAGGLLSVLFLMSRGVAVRAAANLRVMLAPRRHGAGASFQPLRDTAARLPYGVAIAAGTLAALRWPLAGAA